MNSAEGLKATEDVRELLEDLETPEEWRAAVHLESTLRSTYADFHKTQALSRYLDMRPNGSYARVEMQIYRMMGHTSDYFTRNQSIDLYALRRMVSVLEFWVFLAMGGGLGYLVDYEEIQKSHADDSAAEKFRAFLDIQKAKAGCNTWTLDYMHEVLFTVYQAVEAFRNDNQKADTPVEPPAKKARLEANTMLYPREFPVVPSTSSPNKEPHESFASNSTSRQPPSLGGPGGQAKIPSMSSVQSAEVLPPRNPLEWTARIADENDLAEDETLGSFGKTELSLGLFQELVKDLTRK